MHAQALLTIITLATTLGSVYAQTLSNDQINKVKGNLASSATHSWEIGTRMEALLSLDTPSFSVLNSTVPPPKKAPNSLDDVLGSAKSVLSQAPTGNGPKPLFDNDSSAADPASTGIGILIANWTGQSGDYANAAENQINYLLNKAPRAPNGAISHRADEAQLWSDFIYMVPPFLAYYGVTTSNQSMVHEAYNQIKLYRDQLRDSKAGNLWKHIVLGNDHDDDPGHWSTGNAWAAAGMMRVLGTIQHGPFAGSMKDEANDLENWAGEIHDGMFSHLQSSNLFLNYADADKSKSFEDAASTALIAASVYRLSLLSNQTIGKHLRQAEQIRQTLFKSDGSHVGSDGWLKPVVDPMNVGVQGEHSPEGQAFVLELHSAWRDWNATTGGQINASPLQATFSMLSVTIVAASVVVLLTV